MQEENKSNWTVVERITFRTLNTHGKAYFRTVNVLKIYNMLMVMTILSIQFFPKKVHF